MLVISSSGLRGFRARALPDPSDPPAPPFPPLPSSPERRRRRRRRGPPPPSSPSSESSWPWGPSVSSESSESSESPSALALSEGLRRRRPPRRRRRRAPPSPSLDSSPLSSGVPSWSSESGSEASGPRSSLAGWSSCSGALSCSSFSDFSARTSGRTSGRRTSGRTSWRPSSCRHPASSGPDRIPHRRHRSARGTACRSRARRRWPRLRRRPEQPRPSWWCACAAVPSSSPGAGTAPSAPRGPGSRCPGRARRSRWCRPSRTRPARLGARLSGQAWRPPACAPQPSSWASPPASRRGRCRHELRRGQPARRRRHRPATRLPWRSSWPLPSWRGPWRPSSPAPSWRPSSPVATRRHPRACREGCWPPGRSLRCAPSLRGRWWIRRCRAR